MTKPNLPLSVRLEMYSEPDPDTGCVLWVGTTDKCGYGRLGVRHNHKTTNRLTHVLTWETANGPVPEGFQVLHKCDSPPCLNLEHLFLGTQVDNIIDMAKKGRGRTSKAGLPFGVSRQGKRYQAQVAFNGRLHYLGLYTTIEAAASAANEFRVSRYEAAEPKKGSDHE